jgi:type I restriction enzyme S subunit
MSANWVEHLLGDLCSEITVGYVGSMAKEYIDEGIPFFRSKNIREHRIDWSDVKYVSKAFHKKLKKSKLRPGDVAVVRTGKPGTACVIPGEVHEANCSDLVIMRVNPDLLSAHFLSYYLNSIANHQINSRLVGAVQQHFNVGAAKKLSIVVPDIAEQRRIVKIVKDLDDKIKINHKINRTLEQMVRAIFKSWFVDFEPVKAKIAALEAGDSEDDALLSAMQAISGKGEAQLILLHAEQPEQYAELRATAELFPSAMQDSELGEIPKGWDILPLSEMVSLIGGGTPKKSEPRFWNGDIFWFSVKDIPAEGNVFVVDTQDKITQEGLKRSSTKLLPIGATIITARGTVGKLALTGVSTAMNQSCYGVVASDGVGPYLNYLRLLEGVDTLKRNTHGAVFDTITRSTFDTVVQTRSCLALSQRFEQAVTPLFEAVRNNLIQSNTLSATRDSLLPKLLSGELSVFDAEDRLTEAAEVADV